jgi:hypothetical protein
MHVYCLSPSIFKCILSILIPLEISWCSRSYISKFVLNKSPTFALRDWICASRCACFHVVSFFNQTHVSHRTRTLHARTRTFLSMDLLSLVRTYQPTRPSNDGLRPPSSVVSRWHCVCAVIFFSLLHFPHGSIFFINIRAWLMYHVKTALCKLLDMCDALQGRFSNLFFNMFYFVQV